MGTRLDRTGRRLCAALTVIVVAALCAADPARATSFAADDATLGAIPDPAAGVCHDGAPGTRNVTFTVAGLAAGAPTGVGVNFRLTPAVGWAGDLTVRLIAPDGTTSHTIFGRTGALNPGDDRGDGSNIAGPYTFNDGATDSWWTTTLATPFDTPVPAGLYRTSDSGGAGATNPMPPTNMTVAFAALASANGTWTLRFLDGCAGSGSGAVANATLLFGSDVTPPVVTVTAPAHGLVTADTTPSLGGTAEPGGALSVTSKIYAGTTPSGSPLQTHSAFRIGLNWSEQDVTALADGTYTVRAEYADDANNIGYSNANVFRIDTTPPAVTLTAPAEGALTGPTPTLSGAAGAATGDSFTVTVRVYAGATATGTPVQTIDKLRSGSSWSVAAAALAGGTYTAQAEQSDSVGNTTLSATRTFSVDATPPAITLTSPANGTAGPVALPTVQGAAGNASGDSQFITVKIYAGSTPTGTPLQSFGATRSGTSWSVQTPIPLGQGATVTFQAEQSDAVGNTGKSSAHTYRFDSVEPEVIITAPAYGTFVTTATPTITGTAGDAVGDDPNVTVNIYAGVNGTGTPVASTSVPRTATAWSVQSPVALGEGAYSIRASQADNAGNGDLTVPWVFTVDTIAPAVTVTAPADGSATTSPTPELAGGAGNATSDRGEVTVKLYAGASATGPALQEHIVIKDAGTWVTEPDPALPDGLYTVRAEQVDQAGNTGLSNPRTFRVDTTAPAVTLTSPANGSSAKTVTLSGAAGTATGDADTVNVSIWGGATAAGAPLQAIAAPRSGGSWATAAVALPDGTYTARAEQSDDVGLTGRSATVTFTIDTTVPAVPRPSPPGGAPAAAQAGVDFFVRSFKASRTGKVRIRFKARPAGARATIVLTAKLRPRGASRSRTYTLLSGTVTVPANASVSSVLALRRTARRALRSGQRISAKLTVKINGATFTSTVRLTMPSRAARAA